MLDKTAPAVRRIAPGDAMRAVAIVAQRGPRGFHPTAILANIFHHRCRGASLPEELRPNALLHVNLLANQLGVSAPMLDEVIEFVQCKGKSEKVTEFECSPYNLWASVLPTSSLSPLARLLSSLPCSQASVKRVFSAADWAASNRERVGFEKLSREVKLRFNYLRLQEGTVNP